MALDTTSTLLARGVLHSLDLQRPRSGTPLFFQASTRVSAPVDCGSPGMSIFAGGTHDSAEIALIKAAAEGVERHCATRCHSEALLTAPRSALGEDCVEPSSFDLFTTSQRHHPEFPHAPVPDAATPLTWTPGFTLDGKPLWIPASLVHLYHSFPDRADLFEATPVSGYACGQSLEDAMLRGLCEVLERDAFMCSWYACRRTRRLDLERCPSPRVHSVLARFHQVPGHIVCQEITTETGLPAVLAALLCDRGPFPVVVATAAAPSLSAAAAKAIEELSSNFTYLEGVLASGVRIPNSPADVTQMHDHGLFYLRRQRLALLRELLNDSTSAPWPVEPPPADTVSTLASVWQRLRESGLDAFVVDLTRSEVADLGFHVVKVLIPGAHPIDYGLDLPHWGGRRLPALAASWHAGAGTPAPTSWNPWPHPFP